MKKKIATMISAALALIVGDCENDALDEHTRAHLDGDFIELSDGVTHYELKGKREAKTLVLVHGNAAPYVIWDNTVDALIEAGFRVLRYDVFGHGFSDRPEKETYNKDLYDRQLVELLDAFAITRPVCMAGTSQGGSISVYFAATHPERVEKLALLAPFVDSFEGAGTAALLKISLIGETLISLVGDKNLIDPSRGFYSDEKVAILRCQLKEQLRYKGKKRAVLANLRGNSLEDATELYREVQQHGIPILLTWGTQDQSISETSMRRLRELIPTIKYHELENAAHLAHYEFPEKLNPILVNFFKQ